jgi:hypothetical protein
VVAAGIETHRPHITEIPGTINPCLKPHEIGTYGSASAFGPALVSGQGSSLCPESSGGQYALAHHRSGSGDGSRITTAVSPDRRAA